MAQNDIKQLCQFNNAKEAARILYEEEGWDGADEGATVTQLQVDYDLTQEEAEEVFSYIISYEEEDGVERDEFGNVIEEGDGWIC
jgi:hypothetical protein